ncbi:MAG: HEPN domain-containing protein [Candidatus Njordarchaeia archaeon]
MVKWETKAMRFYKSALLNMENSIYDVACFSAHQAVELLLRGIIIEKTGSKPFTHSLLELGQILEEIGFRFPDDVKKCLKELSKHYTQSRYPDARIVDYDKSEAEEAVECMRLVFDYVKHL